MITILGFGSLLSERSSRMTFPELQNFRLGRVPNYRRVFGHPASIFFQRGIANLETKEISSLSAEPCPGHAGFVCSVFEVPNSDMMSENGVPSLAFLEREEEFNILPDVVYHGLDSPDATGTGILCTSSDDETYLSRWERITSKSNMGNTVSILFGGGNAIPDYDRAQFTFDIAI
ncbi:hypothetical protein IV203_038181 [Nitzschia inconspicua]|uniref:Uncharacterized protein n=1 Tax=Nitzschia inconspicua TaxID=303405 RepID=A0A9K3PZ27_9STRA|nr:hypothetical protein IV203_038181 [Nitzschia inconspicua]